MRLLLGLLAAVFLLAPSAAEARNGSASHHTGHSQSAINSYCGIKAYARRHPDKCPGYPTH